MFPVKASRHVKLDEFSGPAAQAAVRHAPGHTEGSVVFELDEVLFSGDVLFAGSIGRTDLPGGDHAAMVESLRRVILPAPDELVVLPGHGPEIGRAHV